MEATALCIRLLTTVFMQLGAPAQEVGAAFWIIPTRLQLFEYESISFECTDFDDLTGWKILRKTRTDISTCGFSKWGVFTESSCTIRGAFPDDSGEYWCEAGGGKRSNSVNITVTGGPVILEGPVLPVMAGEAATLRCRTKMTFSNLTAHFYKDGLLIRSSSSREMTIHSVSQSDKGLYKCRISGAGESPDTWLAVREFHSETHPRSDHMFVILRNVFPIVLMALLLLGLLHFEKLRDVSCAATVSRCTDSQKSNEDSLQMASV